MDIALLSSITAVGIPENDARVYLATLQLGEGTVSQIALKAEIKRSLTYIILGRLIKSGYAIEVPKNHVKRYRVIDPTNLLQKIEANYLNLKYMVPILRNLERNGLKKSRIEFYEDVEGIVSVYRTFEHAKSSRFFSSYAQFQKHFSHEMARWVKASESIPVNSRHLHLIVDEPEGRAMAEKIRYFKGQEYRILPKNLIITIDVAIVDDTLAITSFDPLFIFVIHSKSIAESAGILFDLAWKNTKPLPRPKKT